MNGICVLVVSHPDHVMLIPESQVTNADLTVSLDSAAIQSTKCLAA